MRSTRQSAWAAIKPSFRGFEGIQFRMGEDVFEEANLARDEIRFCLCRGEGWGILLMTEYALNYQELGLELAGWLGPEVMESGRQFSKRLCACLRNAGWGTPQLRRFRKRLEWRRVRCSPTSRPRLS